MAKRPITNPALTTWDNLNSFVMETEDEAVLKKLLMEELSGRKRTQFVKRIHSRINKLRADRERAELEEKLQ
jgi:uncharacterized ferredoxin-like protein